MEDRTNQQFIQICKYKIYVLYCSAQMVISNEMKQKVYTDLMLR